MTQTRFRVPLLLAGLLLASTCLATTYRWIDENGKVQYSDTMPPQQAGKGHKELNKQGRTVREVERSLRTPEERRQAEAAAERAAQAKQQEIDRQRRDRALLSSFTTEAEIDLVRDRALELENLQITSLQARMDNASEKLSYANAQIKKSAGKAPPKAFVQMREEAHGDLAQIGEMLKKSQNNLETLKTKYEADKQRFRELKSVSRP